MICLVGKLPVLKVGRHHVSSYDTAWIDVALQRAAHSCDRADFPFIDDIRDGILHYLEHKCPWRVLPLEDLFERMKRMLRRIGCDAIADNLKPLAPPITLSIARAAREAGNGFELAFYRKLQEEIDDLHARGAEEFHFTELRESARILLGPPSGLPTVIVSTTRSSPSYRILHSNPFLRIAEFSSPLTSESNGISPRT